MTNKEKFKQIIKNWSKNVLYGKGFRRFFSFPWKKC